MSDDNRKEKLWMPFDGDVLEIEWEPNTDKWHRVLEGSFRSWKGRRRIISHTTAWRQPVVSTQIEEYLGPVFYMDTNFMYEGDDDTGFAKREDYVPRKGKLRPHEEAWMDGPSMLDDDPKVQDWNSSIKMDDLLVKSTKEEVLGLSFDEKKELDKAIDKQNKFIDGVYE